MILCLTGGSGLQSYAGASAHGSSVGTLSMRYSLTLVEPFCYTDYVFMPGVYFGSFGLPTVLYRVFRTIITLGRFERIKGDEILYCRHAYCHHITGGGRFTNGSQTSTARLF